MMLLLNGAAKLYAKNQILAESMSQYQSVFKTSKDRFIMIANKIKKDCRDPIEKAEGTPIKDSLISTLPFDAMLRDLNESFTELKKSSCSLAECLRAVKKNENEIESDTNIKTETEFHCNFDWSLNHFVGTRSFSASEIYSSEGKISSDGGVLSDTCKALPLKIEQPDAVRFSGQSRD